jgi:hypothetical protein
MAGGRRDAEARCSDGLEAGLDEREADATSHALGSSIGTSR